MILLEGSAITRTFKGEVVAKFGPGSAIGEVALVDRQKRSANVTSVGKSTAAVLPADALWQLLEADPQVGLVVMRRLAAVLCFRLRSMNEYADTAAPMRGETTARK
jgi:CRP-like cAMP-binding protein